MRDALDDRGGGPCPITAEARRIIGHSAAITRVRQLIARLRACSGSVIITGEPGAGKELVARGLKRPGVPFVTVDAATIVSSTAESILFGHERGAFTGAHTARAGLLEQAHGGILYVDELANMALDVQAKLLRALQEKEVTRLGGNHVRRLNFRLICATNQDLEGLCRLGQFRFDLLTRLSVFHIAVPPLRHRLEDLPALFEFFCRSHGANTCIVPRVWDVLAAYPWPGNVRELSNAAQHAVVMCDDGRIEPEHLPEKLRHASCFMPARARPAGQDVSLLPPVAAATTILSVSGPAGSLAQQLQHVERAILCDALASAGGNISRVAKSLGVDRSSLHHRLRRLGLHPRHKQVPVET